MHSFFTYVINVILVHAFPLQTDTFFFIFVKNEISQMLKNTSPQLPFSQTHVHAHMVQHAHYAVGLFRFLLAAYVALSLELTESIFRQHILAAHVGLQRLESLNGLCLVTLQINQPSNQPTNQPTNQPHLYEFLNFTKYKPNHKMHKGNIIAFIEVYVVSFVLLYIRNSAEFTIVHCKP